MGEEDKVLGRGERCGGKVSGRKERCGGRMEG